MDTFKNRLLTAMGIRKMTQKDVCDRTGIPKSAFSQYVSGAFQPKQERTMKIAAALHVRIEWLLGYDVEMEGWDEESDRFNQELLEDEALLEKYLAERFDSEEIRAEAKELIIELPSMNIDGIKELKKRLGELRRLDEYMSD